MRKFSKKFLNGLELFGINLRQTSRVVRYGSRFIRDIYKYHKATTHEKLPFKIFHLKPIFSDLDKPAGLVGTYFYQDLWAAKKIFQRHPRAHLDVGSRIDGFIAQLLIFMEVEVIDIRPLQQNVPGLMITVGDATNLDRIPNSVESLSSLHAVEHFGLGRYNDPIEPDACFKAMRSFARVLKPGGILYFSVPIGVERLEFNAHRVFAPQTIMKQFKDLTLLSFSAVDDEGHFHEQSRLEDFVDAHCACGLFEFGKLDRCSKPEKVTRG